MGGDQLVNALAETVNGYYKAELIYGPEQGPWRNVDEVGLATLSWGVLVQRRPHYHSHCHDDVPPDEFEAAFYAAQQIAPTGVGNQWPEPPSDPG